MPSPEQMPSEEAKLTTSPSSDPAPDPEEWLEDAFLNARTAHDQKHPA